MPTLVRSAKASDFAAIQALRFQLFSILEKKMPETFCTAPYEPTFLSSTLTDPSQSMFVVEIDSLVHGYIILQCKVADPDQDTTLIQRKYAYILDFCINEGLRGQGLGQLLLDTAIKWAKQHDCTSVELRCIASNRNAIEFYRHQGFVETVLQFRLPV